MVKVVLGTGDAIHDAVAAVYQANPVGSMGPLYIGSCLNFLFLGILFSQVRFYYLNFPRDNLWIKRLIALVFVLSVGKAIVSFMTGWNTNIQSFGNWRIAATISWSMWVAPFCQVLVSTVAQSFFVWRAFTLTGRNWYLLFTLIALMLSVLGCTIAWTYNLTVDPYYRPNSLRVGTPVLIIGLVVDIIITAVVSYKLANSRGGLIPRTDKALSQLLSITWECAAPPALSHILNVILFFTTLVTSTWSALFNTLTPCLYAFSLLHTLNSRITVRSTLAQGTSILPGGDRQGSTSHPTRKGTTTGGTRVSPVVSKREQIALSNMRTAVARKQSSTAVHSSPGAPGRKSEETDFSSRSWTR